MPAVWGAPSRETIAYWDRVIADIREEAARNGGLGWRIARNIEERKRAEMKAIWGLATGRSWTGRLEIANKDRQRGDQWTDEEIARMKAQDRPALTLNKINDDS